MEHTAKLFLNGRSQAVRLPASYRLNCDEVYIRRDSESGDIILSKKPGSWDGFFNLLENTDVPCDFLSNRNNSIEDDKDLF